jgi:hypothetical protein
LHGVRLPDDVVAEDAQGARVGLEQGGDAAHEGGLAGAVGPEHGKDHTLFREQLQAVERGRVPESLNHTGGFDHVRHSVLLSLRTCHVQMGARSSVRPARAWPAVHGL